MEQPSNGSPSLPLAAKKPSWAILACGVTDEASLLAEAVIDPLHTISTNLSLFLVPLICLFTFQLPTLDNLGPDDMSDLSMAHGPIIAEWARIMLLARKQGGMALALYNYLEGQDLLARHFGIRAGKVSLYINKQGPCLSAVSTSSSHPDDYQTLLSRLGGAAIAAAILPPALVLQQVVITSGDETKERKKWPLGMILSSPSSVHFSACSIVLLPMPLHAPCCTTA